MSDLNEQPFDRLRQRLQELATSLAADLQADVVTVILYDDTTGAFHAPVGHGLFDADTFTDARTLPRPGGILSQMLRDWRELPADQVLEHSCLHGPFARREKVISSGGFPVVCQERALGVLFVNYRRHHLFSENDKQRIQAAVRLAADAILADDPFPAVRQVKRNSESDVEKALDAILQHGRTVLDVPMSIWLLQPDGQRLRLQASTGLHKGYMNADGPMVGDGSYLSDIVLGGQFLFLRDLANDGRFGYPEHASVAGWVAAVGVPIRLRGRTGGVLEVFLFEAKQFGQAERNILHLLAELASVTLENAYRAGESRKLAEAVHALRDCPDFSRTLQLVVESARDLTGADSSTIFLLDKRTGRFVLGSRAPECQPIQYSPPRSQGGLTRHIIDTGESILISDTRHDPSVRQEMIQEGVLSVAGVRIQMGEERIGVLFIDGSRQEQFTDDDVIVLKTLADQMSVALNWRQLLLKPDEIEQATSRLAHLDARLKDVCEEIERKLGFEFVAVQLIRPEENTIETLYGTGVAADWVSRAKHYVEMKSDLQDIHASIVLACPPNVEIITGWDTRLDAWIFDTYHHAGFVRVFTPLVLVRDESGRVLPDGAEHLSWREPQHEATRKGERQGERTIIPMEVRDATGCGRGLTLEVIGTVEGGYCDRQLQRVGATEAIALARLASQRAPDIRRTLLPHVLEAISERAMRIVRADSASLHFQYQPHTGRFVYETYSGQFNKSYLNVCPPRPDGLGQQAIKAREPKFIPDCAIDHNADELARRNPQAYADGIRAMAALPLFVDDEVGVLYIRFRREHWFTEAEIAWLQPFANWALDAIRQAIRYTQMRDRVRQLAILHAVAESLVSTPNESDLLQHFAHNTLRILVADIVTIYEYWESDDCFSTPPHIAGRLLAERPMATQILPHDVPALLVKSNKNFYAEPSTENPLLRDSAGTRPAERGPSFVAREGIVCSAGILLKVGIETVGVMFINYRRLHYFSDEEKTIIATLASSAAFAIKNRRLMDTLSTVDGEIINTPRLRAVLDLIAARAAQTTDAKFGAIRRLDLVTQKLETTAFFPVVGSVEFHSDWTLRSIDEGIVGWVTANRKPALVNNVAADPRCTSTIANRGSELCVPLLAKGSRVMGVLHVADPRIGVFHWIDQRMLEALTNQAVIAIQNADNQRHLLAAEMIATLGDLASELAHHKIGRNASLISDYAKGIKKDGASIVAIHSAKEIETLAEELADAAKELETWIVDPKAKPVNLHHALANALGDLTIPSSISLERSIPDDLPQVLGSGRQLRQVLVILIQNAIDAMPQGGVLRIAGQGLIVEKECWVIFWVEDTGMGIVKNNLERIFERGYTTKNGTQTGLGFGLWWARAYAERLRGELLVDSIPDQGAKLTLRLPASSASNLN